ncbi:MAG: sugar kinase [Microbacteriaceae bacterium]|jgi:2-dehydro-3-deoxygluconokinase|nr:sugar kinase [Microbacteriaceae bacterium]
MSRVVTIGETMGMMSSVTVGPLAHAGSLALGIGGSESNVAIGLARLGVDVTWIGKVGADSLGDLVVREITAEGVTVAAIRDPDAATAVMIKERRSSTQTKVWYYRADHAGSRLRVDEVDLDLVRGADLLHVTGISLALSPGMAEVITEAVAAAREAGVLVSFDLNYRGKLWSTAAAAEAYRAIIPLVDVVFAGDDEAAIAVGAADDPVELAHRLVSLGAGQAVIKLGAQGAVASVDGTDFSVPAVPITALDTVGAGDAFVAGYLAELLAGEDATTRLSTAVKTGAYACLTNGDWEGLPRRSELDGLTAREPVAR